MKRLLHNTYFSWRYPLSRLLCKCCASTPSVLARVQEADFCREVRPYFSFIFLAGSA